MLIARPQFTALIFCFLVASSVQAGEIFSCEDEAGKTVYTDDKNKCNEKASPVDIKTTKDKRVNYRYPKRHYVDKSTKYSIFIESPESDRTRNQLNSAVEKLDGTLDYIFAQIPKSSHAYLKEIDFYIMIGPEAKLGGETNGLRYFPKSGDATLLLGDEKWAHTIVIYNVENYLWISDLWKKKSVVHELSHAWHYKDWPHNYPILKRTWLSARQKALYLSQKDLNGKILKPAYASTNEKEYFSELSAMYFVGCNYYPFNREQLKEYDFEGYQMVRNIWGL